MANALLTKQGVEMRVMMFSLAESLVSYDSRRRSFWKPPGAAWGSSIDLTETALSAFTGAAGAYQRTSEKSDGLHRMDCDVEMGQQLPLL
jgi:hypothetical protein